MAATFSNEAELSAHSIPVDTKVFREGKIFEVGEYPDKEFELTEAEADAAIAEFKPVPLDLEHMPTILDGKLGQVTAMYRKGKELFGAVELPSWLDNLLAPEERKVSCTWDRATKKLKALALVRTPRVPDAALMAAFAASSFAFPVAGQAAAGPPAPAGAAQPPMQKNPMQTVHDFCVKNGAVCSAPQPAAPAGPPAQMSESEARMSAQIEELVKKNDQIEVAAEMNRLVTEKKILPAEVALLTEFGLQLRVDDRQGEATFSSGKAARFAKFMEALKARPAHLLTQELLNDQSVSGLTILPEGQAEFQGVSDARTQELLQASSLGQAILDQTKGT